ncbi:hypothetical protein K445DRAFT_73804 [Daldinia sp. EC12]|nr:hypothetical protein K445DRAFT_73804 [Daldinia sp. EC12]
MAAALQRFTLIFYAPTSAVAACKSAIFSAGAGRSDPHIGSVGALEEVPEIRVETLCVGEDVVKRAVKALKGAHPYEEPAYHVIKLENY